MYKARDRLDLSFGQRHWLTELARWHRSRTAEALGVGQSFGLTTGGSIAPTDGCHCGYCRYGLERVHRIF